MRRLSILAAAAVLAAGLAPAFAPLPALADEAGTRDGPFVLTDRTLTSLLEEGYEIEGLLGGAMILVKGASLYSCALAPDREALTYKPHFACSVLDEIAPEGDTQGAE